MLFKLAGNAFNIDFGLVVFCFECGNFGGFFAEKAQEALFVRSCIEPAQLADKVRYHVPCLPEILCADVFKRTFGKISHFFLSVRAVTHNLRRIGDVDLLRKGINGGKLVGGEIGVLLHEFIAGFDGFRSRGLLFRRSLCAERVESQSGHCCCFVVGFHLFSFPLNAL